MLDGLLAAIETAPAIEALRVSSWIYPAVNTLHIIGIALLFGAIVPLDLRLAGGRRGPGLAALAQALLPVAVSGFALAAAAGLLLFATDARTYAASPLFQAKLALIAAALVNAALLRRVDWRSPSVSSRRLAGAGVSSLLLWTAVITLGRWIAYV
nr:hypothetical protein [uncultured Sphingomonas sp.]